MDNRLKKVKKSLQERNLEAIMVGSYGNRYYLSGFTGSAGIVLVTPQADYLVTDFRYTEQAKNQVHHLNLVEHGLNRLEKIAALLTQAGIKRVGFEAHIETFDFVENKLKKEIPHVEWVPTTAVVENIRLYKEQPEIATLQEAVTLADRAFEHICSFIKPGQTEKEVALELEMFFRRHGSPGSSFPIIVASGYRSALAHGVASDKVIEKGDLVVIDIGAKWQGYVSDLTRTVVVGEADNKQKEIYEIVLQAQLNALTGLKPGMTGKEADYLARKLIDDAGYKDYFGHGLGHGVGIEIHEGPRLSPLGEERLEKGMAFTVEPGIYLAGWGGVRIEDVVVLEAEGARILTRATKKLIQI